MAKATYVHDGGSIDHTPSAAVAAGDVVVQNDLAGVARTPIAANALGSLAVTGVFDVAKATGAGTAIEAGKKVYWDAANGVATTSADDGGEPATAYPYLGKTVKAATDADTTVRVRLSQ
ncbi:MAG: hypothetical protein BWX88_05191 [Planctomycetes bacterium ADurb.Bin126]|nr:MAG: hypothetical protein BWX88_05191 [Planctomycetes bacterium ADurb.Bin126]HOD84959.1 DUF2190 family protein [Phycisphaerae bacterium]HQL76050.1 DUF2190 family protein [Phycisphaerae bacterium]